MSNGYTSGELLDKKYITYNQYIEWQYWNEYNSDGDASKANSDVQYVQKLMDTDKAELDEKKVMPQNADGMPEKPALPEGTPKPPPDNLPPAQNTDESNGNSIRIDTDILETFSGNVLKLEKYLDDALAELAKVNITPGIFGAGTNLHGVYVGKGEAQGLHGNVQAFIKSLKETFFDLRADVDNMVLDFKTTEEIAEMSTDQLKTVFGETFGDIQGLSKHVK